MQKKREGKLYSSFIEKRYYLPVISALLLFASIFPTYLLISNFIFLVPLLFFLQHAKNGKEAFKGGILFGFVAYAAIFHWIYSFFSISIFLALFLYLAILVYFSLMCAILVFLAYLIYSRWKIRFFLFMPLLWIIVEHARTFGPFRITIDHVAFSMATFPQLIQFIDITGPYGITFWLILVNALIFEAIVSFRKKAGWIKYAAAAVLITILPAAYSFYEWNRLTYEPDLKISMIQPNIPFEKKMKKGFETENMDLLVSMTSEAIREDPDIIIWPETSYPNLILHRVDQDPEPVLPEVSQLARSSQTPILVGANYARIRSREDFDVYNAAFLVDSRGDIQDYYAKIYLVPFTEALPFREVFGIQKGRKSGLLALLANFSAGNKFSVFEIESKPRPLNDETGVMGGEVKVTGKRKERFGVLVCYEGLYSELSRQLRKEKADFLVCITNDAWFGRTIAPYWHASALRLRAIENRISIARCANTGVSCFFDPAGRMYQSSEIFTKGVITGSILAAPPFPPLYTRRGNVIVYFAYAALLFMIILAAFLRKKTFKKK